MTTTNEKFIDLVKLWYGSLTSCATVRFCNFTNSLGPGIILFII
jgi:hypothetical protein